MTTQLWRTATLFLLLAATSVTQADWQITSTKRETSPNDLVEHWTDVVENAATASRATLHFAVFETRKATIRVIDQPDTPRSGLAEVMKQTKALAGVNGGYFDPEDAPLGLRVSDGRILSRFRRAKLLTGVFFATKSRVDIVRATRFSMNDGIKSALQCGPLLVERAAPVAGLNDTRPARRTFAVVDENGRAAIGICSAVTLAELSRILCLTNLAGKTRIARALNLDGGSSSAFWFSGTEEPFSVREVKTVRDFVAIVPR